MSGTATSYATRAGSSAWSYLRECGRIDGRSLALFRIAIALLVVADLFSRARNFSFYYTDDGAVTQSVAEASTDDAFSFFYYTSDPSLIGGLFVLHGVVALLLLVGYKTRLMTVLTFLFVISLDHHNPLVLSYADTLFRLLLFWAMLLPLGARWSVDAAHRGEIRASFVGIVGLLAMGQMVMMYFINATNKHGSELWRSGEAAVIVFGIDEMTFLIGDQLRVVPELLQLGGWVWFSILFASPLLILLHGRWRLPLLALFAGGHLSFALTVRIGAFAYVAIAGLLLFLPRELYADLASLARRLGLVSRYQRLRPRAIRAGRRLPRLWPGHPRVAQLRQTAYVLVVAVVVVALVVSAALVAPQAGLLWEADPSPDQEPDERIQGSTIGGEIYDVADTFGVTQPEWSIFAGPGPRSTDRYYVFPARTEDGDEIDVYNGGRELTFERPSEQLQTQHDAYRERFYMNSVRRSGWVARLYAEHLCETWPEQHGQNLTQIEMHEVWERITTDTIDNHENRDQFTNELYTYDCELDAPINIDIGDPDL